MERYDYLENVKKDVREWINEHETFCAEYADDSGKWLREDNREDIEQGLYDRLFCEDSVTGNASGSYTCNTWQAEENLCHNLDILSEALAEFGCGLEYITENGVEACDVSIRCYLLPQAISEVLDEMEDEDEE